MHRRGVSLYADSPSRRPPWLGGRNLDDDRRARLAALTPQRGACAARSPWRRRRASQPRLARPALRAKAIQEWASGSLAKNASKRELASRAVTRCESFRKPCRPRRELQLLRVIAHHADIRVVEPRRSLGVDLQRQLDFRAGAALQLHHNRIDYRVERLHKAVHVDFDRPIEPVRLRRCRRR